MTTTFEPTQLISALLGDRRADWPAQPPRDAESAFLSACSRHGVTPLVHEKLKDRLDWPAELRETCRRKNLDIALRQALDDQEVTSLLPRLNAVGVSPLILKGAAFAHLLYPKPHLRPREDTDLLIRPEESDRVREALIGLGYAEIPAHTGELIMFQKSFRRLVVQGHWHTFDVHWKISNAHVFSDRLPYDELSARSIPVPALGLEAKAPSSSDALLHACMHRVGHHRSSLRLLWLHDILLLARQVDGGAKGEFLRLATEKALGAVCLDGLRAARAFFDSSTLDRLIDSLSTIAPGGDVEAGADLLGAKGRRSVLWSDFRSQPTLRRKIQWTRENLVPPASHVLPEGGSANRLKLGGLYLKRAVRGCWRILTEKKR